MVIYSLMRVSVRFTFLLELSRERQPIINAVKFQI